MLTLIRLFTIDDKIRHRKRKKNRTETNENISCNRKIFIIPANIRFQLKMINSVLKKN